MQSARADIRVDFRPLDVQRPISKEDLTIVIPTWNEVEAIGKVIDEVREYGYAKILVIDGYSTDGTAKLASDRGVRVLSQGGKGKTGALATAVQYVDTPFMLVMDGDCTYDPSCIETLAAHAEAYDEVIGARTTGRENIPALNRLGNRFLSWFFKSMFAVNLTDVCSGMYLIRTEAARLLEFTTGGFDVEVEIAAQLSLRGRITEVPIKYRARVGRQKLSSLRHGLTIGTSILRLANIHNPVVLYSGFIAISALPALAIFAWVAYERFFRDRWHAGYALFGTLLMLMALQALAVGTLSLVIRRSEQRIYRALRGNK